MVVYGDPQFTAGFAEVLDGLERSLTTFCGSDVDAARALLIQSGQFEQGVADAVQQENALPEAAIPLAQTLTDALARHFVEVILERHREWRAELPRGISARCPWGPRPGPELLAPLRRLNACGTEQITLKLPEGFEFYSLFPEQYCRAALSWMKRRSAELPGSAWVIGVRGIGTTLSAVVAATLETGSWKAPRSTVRPTGPPYARVSALPKLLPATAQWALVVDEGPGLSGSSVASVAAALEARGFPLSRIAFFPGHSGDPGHAASEAVRRYWIEIPRYTARFTPVLAAKTGGAHAPAHDLGGGLWRQFAYEREADWPAVAARFETAKFLCGTQPGERVLWKFIGLGAWIDLGQTALEVTWSQLNRLAAESWCLAPLGKISGYIATPWVEGVRLARHDGLDREVVAHVGRYLVRAATDPLSAVEQERAVERLAFMTYHNVREGLGEEAAQALQKRAFPGGVGRPLPSCGDGHLAPHEWVRTARGRIVKTDCAGHSADHTIIGRQSLLWGIAGALVEWEFAGAQREWFLATVESDTGPLSLHALAWYELAYAAFRYGQTVFCLELEPRGSSEFNRLALARDRYRRRLAEGLGGLEALRHERELEM